MNKLLAKTGVSGLFLMLLLIALVPCAQAVIPGVSGTDFSFTVRDGYISLPDGGTIYTWGYAIDNNVMQYPRRKVMWRFLTASFSKRDLFA